jgi:hypothetical protein
MANSAIATPTLLTDPGFLYWAPVGSTLPTGTVVGSVFTDTWPVAWIPLGMTDSGTKFSPNLTVNPITAAESIDPIAYRTTDRSTSITFMLKSFTATNLQRALNGATTTVTGATTTTMTKLDPPQPGSETRCMIGFESLDSTFRFIAYQVINSGSIDLTFDKAPSNTSIPWNAMLEKPTSTQPFSIWTAGVARA